MPTAQSLLVSPSASVEFLVWSRLSMILAKSIFMFWTAQLSVSSTLTILSQKLGHIKWKWKNRKVYPLMMRGFAFLMWGTGVSMKGSKQEEHWMCQRLVWKVLPPQCSQTLVFPIVSAVKFILRCSKIRESFKQTDDCRQKRPTEKNVQNTLNRAVQIELVKSKSSKENGKQCGGVLISHSNGGLEEEIFCSGVHNIEGCYDHAKDQSHCENPNHTNQEEQPDDLQKFPHRTEKPLDFHT